MWIKLSTHQSQKQRCSCFAGSSGPSTKDIPNWAWVLRPITDLISKSISKNVTVTGKWTSNAFDKIKQWTASGPALGFFRMNTDHIWQTDDCDKQIEATILQREEDDNLYPVTYASRKLLHWESKYAISEKEASATFYAVHRFYKYVWEKVHHSLLFIQKPSKNARILRRQVFLQDYDFAVQVIKPLTEVPHRTTPTLSEWTTVTADEIDKLIDTVPNKTSQLQSIPTWLMKEVRGLVLWKKLLQFQRYRIFPRGLLFWRVQYIACSSHFFVPSHKDQCLSAIVYFVHCRQHQQRLCQLSCVCQWFTAIHTLCSLQHSFNCCMTRNTASPTSATGCLQTSWNLMRRRQSRYKTQSVTIG